MGFPYITPYDGRHAREMSRQRQSGTLNSMASSTGSRHGTITPDDRSVTSRATLDTEWDPVRDEIEGSTGIVFPEYGSEEHRQMLKHENPDRPRTRDLPPGARQKRVMHPDAERYRYPSSRWTPKEQDVSVSESALGQAFADFSSGRLEVVSVEDARTPTHQTRVSASTNGHVRSVERPISPTARVLTPSIVNIIKDNNVFQKPTERQSVQNKPSSIIQDAFRNSLKANYRAATGENRSRAEMQAHVTDGSQDGSMMGDDRISTGTVQLNNSRFRNAAKENVRPTSDEAHQHIELQTHVTDGGQRSSTLDVARVSSTTHSKGSRFSKVEPRAQASEAQYVSVARPQYPEVLSRKETARVLENAQRLRQNYDETPIRQSSRIRASHGQKSATGNANHTAASSTTNPTQTQKSFFSPVQQSPSDVGTTTGTVLNHGVPVQVREGRVHDRQGSNGGARRISRADDMDADPEEEDLYAMLDEARDRNAELEALLNTAHSTIHKLQSENQHLSDNKDQLYARRRSDSGVGESDDDGSKRQARNEMEIEKLCSGLRTDNEVIRNENTALIKEVDGLKLQLAQLAADCEALEVGNAHFDVANQELNHHVADLTAKCDSTDRRLFESENEIQHLRSELATVMAERDNMANSCISKESNLDKQVKKLIVERQQLILEKQQIRNDCKNQIHQLKTERNEKSHIWEAKESSLIATIRRQERAIGRIQKRADRLADSSNQADNLVNNPGFPSRSDSGKALTAPAAVGQLSPPKTGSICQESNDDDTFEHYELDPNITQETGDESNYSDVLGHGVMENFRRNEAAFQEHFDHPDRTEPANTVSTQDQTIQGGRPNPDDITSGRLVDDIMAAKKDDTTKDRPVLSVDARLVCDGLCEHSRKKCTTCSRVATFNKDTVTVPRPVPVSERMPEYEDEPTLRPSMPPGEALAIVIQGLKDEVKLLDAKIESVQKAYMDRDVSGGRRHRESSYRELQDCLADRERKSAQIYSLYDVLEGQKQAGQEMTKDRLDVTLTRFGVNLSEQDWEGIADDY